MAPSTTIRRSSDRPKRRGQVQVILGSVKIKQKTQESKSMYNPNVKVNIVLPCFQIENNFGPTDVTS